MDAAELLFPLLMTGLLVMSAAVSASETACFSLGAGQLAEFSRSRQRLGQLVARLMSLPSDLLLTILLVNNAVNIAYFAIASAWAGHQTSTLAATSISLGAIALLILFGEIMPKVVASSRPVSIAQFLAPMLWLLRLLSTPLRYLLTRPLSRFLKEGAESRRRDVDEPAISGDELKLVIERSHEHGVVSGLVHDRLVEIVELSDVPVASIMVPRVDCCSVADGCDRSTAVAALRQRPAEWLLLTDADEACVGLVASQDLLRSDRPLRRSRRPLFVPAGASLAQALDLLRQRGREAAVVVDEYGGTAGLLTLERIADRILGGSGDGDHDAPVDLGEGRWRLPGSLSLEDWDMLIAPDDRVGCRTVGGFIVRTLGALPQAGDRLLYRNLLFAVEQVEGRRIRSVLVQQLAAGDARRMTQEHRP